MRSVAVVGGSLAGVHAAEALRESGFEGELTLVSGEDMLPYDRPPLSKEALLTGVQPSKLLLRAPEWYSDNAVTTKLGRRAVGLDIRRRTIRLDDGSTLDYDGLVIATGSRARRFPTIPGVPDPHVVRELRDAASLRDELAPGKHLVLVGGGFICLEIASTARQLGLEVTVVEVAQVPLARALGDHVGRWFRDLHTRHDVNVECGAALERVESHGNGARIHLGNGRQLDADVVVAGIGATPATDWLFGSGLDLVNGIRCGADLSTSAPGVVAAGDIARWYNPAFDEEMRVEHWTNAVEQGRHAASTLLGNSEAFSSVPYFWTDQHDARMRFVGRAEAADDVVVETMEDNKLVALYGRDGFIRGAICVNAPKQLAKYRRAIHDNVPWGDVADGLPALARAV